jgi:hypothetical protein
MPKNVPRLCYIEGNRAGFFAYFSSKEHPTGDDWNDVPYEHNAGIPYEYDEIIPFIGDSLSGFELPEGLNLSVDDINEGKAPWLRTWDGKELYAGATVEEFIDFVLGNGGKIFREGRRIIGTCKECKWWEKDEMLVEDMGFCNRENTQFYCTHEDFSCIHWARRNKDDTEV